MSKFSLTTLLARRGIEKIEDLSPEEKSTFDRFKAVLSGETLTVESLKNFCQSQIRIIESASDGKTPLSMLQQASLHVYINLLKAIEAPEAERKALEQHLMQIANGN